MPNIIQKEQPGGADWICEECGESCFQGQFALERGIAYIINHDVKCSGYVAPPRKQHPHELAAEDYRLGRRSDGNSDTL